MLICKHADNAIRWKEGERLDHLFEQRCDEFSRQRHGTEAVVTDDAALHASASSTTAPTRSRATCSSRASKSGDRVGLLFDKTIDTYVALLAVLKVNAAYVPLDAGFPNERIALHPEGCRRQGDRVAVGLPREARRVRRPRRSFSTPPSARSTDKPTARLDRRREGRRRSISSPTSSTPRARPATPKGVAIEHASICNFVRVAAEVYGIRQGDRVYQGMTIAFDFSVEELWVPLIAGATLVPGKPGASLVGDDLADFLRQRNVTVPVLRADAAGDDREGPARPAHPAGLGRGLPAQSRGRAGIGPGRTILNAYGPTEATVTATLTELYPDKPVTIGGPLPTYSIVILDRAQGRGARDGRDGRDRHRRHRARGRLSQPRRPDAEEVHPRLPRTSRTTRPGASTAPATSAASTSTTRSSSTAASTPRSRSAAIGSS